MKQMQHPELDSTPSPPRRDLQWICAVVDFVRRGSMGLVGGGSWSLRREPDGEYVARFRLTWCPQSELQMAVRDAAKGEASRQTKQFLLQSVRFVRERGEDWMVWSFYEKKMLQVGRSH